MIDLKDDDGFIVVQLPNGGEVRLDLYRTHNRLIDFHKTHTGSTESYYDGINEIMAALGLPAGSQKLADRFVKGIMDAVEAVKKKPETTPDSPASTDSTPPA